MTSSCSWIPQLAASDLLTHSLSAGRHPVVIDRAEGKKKKSTNDQEKNPDYKQLQLYSDTDCNFTMAFYIYVFITVLHFERSYTQKPLVLTIHWYKRPAGFQLNSDQSKTQLSNELCVWVHPRLYGYFWICTSPTSCPVHTNRKAISPVHIWTTWTFCFHAFVT